MYSFAVHLLKCFREGGPGKLDCVCCLDPGRRKCSCCDLSHCCASIGAYLPCYSCPLNLNGLKSAPAGHQDRRSCRHSNPSMPACRLQGSTWPLEHQLWKHSCCWCQCLDWIRGAQPLWCIFTGADTHAQQGRTAVVRKILGPCHHCWS